MDIARKGMTREWLNHESFLKRPTRLAILRSIRLNADTARQALFDTSNTNNPEGGVEYFLRSSRDVLTHFCDRVSYTIA